MSSATNVAVVRLLICCAAWAAGMVLINVSGAYALDPLGPAALFAAAYWLTQDLGTRGGGGGGGNVRYWRGRPVDGRWN